MYHYQQISPWILTETKVDLTLSGKNNNRSTQQYINSYHSYVQIYTDTSRSSTSGLGVAFVISEINDNLANGINDGFSVCTGQKVGNIVSIIRS